MHLDLYGLVLVGGASKRMGRDKFSLFYGEKAQSLRVYELLSSMLKKVYFSLRADQLSNFIKIFSHSNSNQDQPNYISDIFAERTPLTGILSAQKAIPQVAWLVVACDLPFLTPGTINTLIEARNQLNKKKLVTCYLNKSNPKGSKIGSILEPLCAIYEPEIFPYLKSNFEKKIYCPRKIISNLDTKIVIELENPNALYNTNTFAEYEWAKKNLSANKF